MSHLDTIAQAAAPAAEVFLAFHPDLPGQGPGSDATTRCLWDLVGPLPASPRVLDAGCGADRSALLLAGEAGAQVVSVDPHQSFLGSLCAAAARRGLGEHIALHPLRTHAENADAAQAASYRLHAHQPLPESGWWDECYSPLGQRIAQTGATQPGTVQALATACAEIAMRHEHGNDYATYLRYPDDDVSGAIENGTTVTTWTTRPETSEDIAAVRHINLGAFPTSGEADLVDALRTDPKAWIDGLSMVTEAPNGTLVGHALLTRCHVSGEPALALAPCAVLPSAQRTGAGSAAINAALAAARTMGENLVLVLGHADYYPRFGFTPASRYNICAPFDVPDEAMMALVLDNTRPVPAGTIQYPTAFGI
ncbi:GNAT family N-acetyltransferase [Streptomyces sp. IBSNAI002]|uniref:GNAT family N-acetyltransferase n=1 Tax=Streptomyces sp. IBSNAI002 TaxID=3457500 RepID=UPI003FD29D14